jgi:tRNA (guanine-N7-)-methyltransferase
MTMESSTTGSDIKGSVDIDSTLIEGIVGDRPIVWRELFSADRPVEIEVGSGKGLFLANAAARRPDRSFVGLEVSRKYAREAAARIAKAGLTNVKLMRGDARIFFDRPVPPASVETIHVYFPDPWWKRRHRKRRIFNDWFVDRVIVSLVRGGELRLATDVSEYYESIIKLIARRAELIAVDFPEPGEPIAGEADYLTNFERKYRIEGRSIYRACYQKTNG